MRMGEIFLGQATIEFKTNDRPFPEDEEPIWLNTSLPAIGAVTLNGTNLSKWAR